MSERVHRAAVLLHDLDVMLGEDFRAADPLVAQAALRGSVHVQAVLASFEEIALRQADMHDLVARSRTVTAA